MLEYAEKFSWLVPLVLIYLIFAYFTRRSDLKKRKEATDWQYERLRTQWLTAQRFYLETLQRELANLILREDIEALEKAFHSVRHWDREVSRSSQERWDAEQALLLEKFPNLQDFDLIATKHFIRYDHRPQWSIDELVDRYKEIMKLLMLRRYLKQGEEEFYPNQFDDDEVRIFDERIQTYKDYRLKNEMESAMSRYHNRRDIAEDGYDDDDYQVTALWREKDREFTPDSQYGIFCKRLNEYGVYSFFAADDDKTFRSYYRSDPSFSKQAGLYP